ncbi:MAG TPA: NAD(P)H-dependent oxidoreductase [Clostridiales bacterium]|nr:NAD(P)H-dependent oxidoreductase [Clostridiales bacterium]
MKYLVISSHPYKGSFNAAATKAIMETASEKGHDIKEIDLVADHFNPVMTSEDLNAWRHGQTIDPLVKTYREAMEDADVLVFLFPIWWGSMPAVLKGFCDKVLLPGWAYCYGESGEMIGLLTTKKAIVVTTMQTAEDVFETMFRNPVDGGFIKDTLQTCGIEVLHYVQIDQILTGGREYTESKIVEIKGLIK